MTARRQHDGAAQTLLLRPCDGRVYAAQGPDSRDEIGTNRQAGCLVLLDHVRDQHDPPRRGLERTRRAPHEGDSTEHRECLV